MLEINWKIEDSMKVWLLLHKEAFEQKSGKQEIVPEMFYHSVRYSELLSQ
jgi:hypothetical protein